MIPEQMLNKVGKYTNGLWDFTNNVILENNSWDKPTLISTSDLVPFMEDNYSHLTFIKRGSLLYSITAICNWRYSKFVYKYTEPMIEGLEDVDIDEVPVDVLTYLPAHCVYIDLSENAVFAYDRYIEGFFAYHNEDKLNIVVKFINAVNTVTIPILLKDKADISDCLFGGIVSNGGASEIEEKFGAEGAVDSMLVYAKKCLVYLVYICSDLPDMDKQNNTSYKDYLAPNKTKKGVKIFAPDKVSLRRVGVK